MRIEFESRVECVGDRRHVVAFAACVPTAQEAHTLRKFVEAALRQAAGRQKVKESALILPKTLVRDA